MAPVTGPMPGFPRVVARLFTLQASWNYERLQGVGFGHAAEPALRALEGGPGGGAYRAALARQARFFNAHPYFAGLAVGAAVRAELEGEAPERIARLREALCGPLGSLGDRLFWASWLPTCAAIGLILEAFGARGWAVAAFLVLYNVVHVGCRVWALRAGWARGMNVVGALQLPLLRVANRLAAPVAGLAVGAVVPIAFGAQLRGSSPHTWLVAAAGAALFALALRLAGPRAAGIAFAAAVLGLTWAVGLIWP
jgi:mannose/fructose/N-acetylgalactosamine-specific phosphotransferase system component IID